MPMSPIIPLHPFRTFALFALSCVASVALVEASLRLYFLGSLRQPAAIDPLVIWDPHETRGWTLAKNVWAKIQTVDYLTTFRTNSRGLADNEHDYDPAPRTTRIVVLGDSFMDATQVPFDASFSRKLAADVKGAQVEVINLGVAGYGTFQEYLYFIEEGLKYKPDIVLVAFYALNDVHNNSPRLSNAVWGPDNIQTFGRPYPIFGENGPIPPEVDRVRAFHKDRVQRAEKAAPGSVLENSMIYQILDLNRERRQTEIWTPTADLNVYIGPLLHEYSQDLVKNGKISIGQYSEMWDEAWALTFRSLELLQRACADAHASLVLFAIPDKLQIEEPYRAACKRKWPEIQFDLDKPNRILSDYCAKHQLLYVDLLPDFVKGEGDSRGPYYYVLRDRHWNANGHALAAEVVAGFLQTHKLVPAPIASAR